MEEPTDAEITRLLPILSARARAAQGTTSAFRPPQTGIVELVGSDWHHFVVGRRGVGKSMLLLTVKQRAENAGQSVAYIDIETLRDNPFPDVLIQLLIALTSALEENLSSRRLQGGLGVWRSRRTARRRLQHLRGRLMVLLNDPQEARHQLSESHGMMRRRSRKGAVAAPLPEGYGVSGTMEMTGSSARSSERSSAKEAEFTRTKLDGLRAEAITFRRVLQEAVEASSVGGALVILDDFYFIRRENQPDVLAYLQQVVKNLNIWLKVGAVEHRLNEFEDGDPPRGLQLTQDAGKVQMDNTLADFRHTQRFLENILRDICKEAGVDMDRVVTERARTRLVLASGGVPRDYLNLVLASLGKASKRAGEPNRPKNRITAEDLNTAAPDFLKQKEDDLIVDSGPDDVDRLRTQLDDVLNFCLNIRQINVFLVETRSLREEQWGRDIAALSDLRFFHRLGNLTVKSSETAYVGKRYDAFGLDLSSYATTRVQTKEIDFWTTVGFQRLRGASNVYKPLKLKDSKASPEADDGESTEYSFPAGQIDLFEMIRGAEAEE